MYVSQPIILVILATLFLGSCSVERYLQEEERLYGQAVVRLQAPEHYVDASRVRSDLLELSQPKPNSPLWLWTYYTFGDSVEGKGLGNFIKRKFGEPPVFYNDEEAERTRLSMRKYLYDHGYFSAEITYDTTVEHKEVTVHYGISSTGRHRLRNVYLPEDSSAITGVIQRIAGRSFLIPGQHYSLTNLVNERRRVATEARNQGYFDFTEDDLFYFVDTNAVADPDSLWSDLWMKVRPPDRTADYRQYRIGLSYIYPNYNLSLTNATGRWDTTVYKDLRILQNRAIVKARTLDESVTQKLGDVFSEERQVATTNHLLDLGIYKFVNLKYRIREEADTFFLDRYIYLTPGEVQNVSAELESTTRANVFGMSIKGSYAHKNIFNGAERLDLSLSTGFENGGRVLISDDTLRNNLVEVTGRAEISIPRFVVPFVRVDRSSAFHIPRTKIGFVANFQRRRQLFSSSNYRLTFGYDWEETRRKRHQIDLFSLNVVTITDQSETFTRLLDESIRLRRSLSNLVILGSTYTYTLTNQEINTLKNYFFFLGQFEAAGNTTYLGSRLFNADAERPYRIFGREFSQFVKFDVDLRFHWVRRKSSLVTRITPGFGLPYLNASSLPYIKQYFVGGASSMRAFPIRGLLGSYREDPNSTVAVTNFEQTGEVKFEGNVEYRFDLWEDLYLKGAVFADVGNIWLLDPQREEPDRRKVFSASRMLSELAVGIGAGIRVDIQYVVLRFDLAVPLRKPFLPEGRRWTFDNMGGAGWFGDNLTFNLALGYPF